MYPAQTSLIPITVAITSFLETNGIKALFGNYPYWYLGVPAKFLLGPIVPIVTVFLHRILPNVSLFSIMIYLVLLSFLIASLGWGILARKISKSKVIGFIVFFLSLILPYRYLSAFAFSEASLVIAKNLLPFGLIFYWNYLLNKNRKNALITVSVISVIFFISTGVMSTLVVGLASLIVSSSYKKGKMKDMEKKIKAVFLLLLLSLAIVTLWYTPSYWLAIITNPSIGGAIGYKVILRLFDLLRSLAPLILAMVVVYFSVKINKRLTIFSLTWVLTFLFLTIYRFIGDPDFWQDWTSWVYELEIGVAFLVSRPISSLYNKLRSKSNDIQYGSKIYIATIILIISPFLLSFYIYSISGKQRIISSNIPRVVASFEILGKLANDERVFLSGSTTFWVNSISNLNQVRGGVDNVAKHPFWDYAAYQLREGSDSELARSWLEALGVSYVLVHTDKSFEVYHDFRFINKWTKIGEKVWQGNGDEIYQIKDSSMAWVVDKDMIKMTKSPESGIDIKALNNYLSAKKANIDFQWISVNEIVLKFEKLEENEGIVLAISYDKKWKTANATVSKDALGNMLLVPINTHDDIIYLNYN